MCLSMQLFWRKITPTKFLTLGYLVIILAGALLLMLPFSTRSGQGTPFFDALFTSASATCVTGLVIYDTYTYWSGFGQAVILFLIQIGGLGFVTLAIAVTTFTKRKIGLKQRCVMQESIAAPQMGGIVRLTRFVFYGTLSCEIAGALVLSFRLCPLFGFTKGIYFSVFHSISAFCNAGFDLMGALEPSSSLTRFSGDPLINLPVMFLIVIGGLGFFVWEDLWHHRHHWNQYRLHTKTVLAATGLLIVVSGVLFFFLEANGAAFDGESTGEKILASLFQAITPRTAGFNTVQLTKLNGASIFLTIALMLIGGSPGSTAGGIKTTTAALFVLDVASMWRKSPSIEYFKRRVDHDVLRNASTVLTLYLFFIGLSTMLISWVEGVTMTESMFESVSAIGTVGLSLGITPALHVPSKLILTFLMYFGRVGCLTILYSIADSRSAAPSKMPLERIVVG